MKKSIFLSVLLCFLMMGWGYGQIMNRGNFVVGSSLGFSTSSSSIQMTTSTSDEEGQGPSALQISFAPKIGYFLQDNFALGLGMDLTFSSLKEPNQDRTDDSDLLFGPFVRYYSHVICFCTSSKFCCLQHDTNTYA